MLKKIARGVGLVLLLLVVAAAGFAFFAVSAFDASISKVYAVKPLALAASRDPELLARGKHLVQIDGCLGCHGDDLGGKPGEDMGPIGVIHAPNLTTGDGGVLARYSDGALARVVRHGLKSDGRSLRFMPAQDLAWTPDRDLVALVSYLRSVPPVDRRLPESHVGIFAKVLDRTNMIAIDIARRIDHGEHRPAVLEPTPTAAYGANLARSCTGCHGTTMSGGKIPGAPSNLPIPANITPHETGIKQYTEADFMRLLDTGVKRDGKKLDPFMPIEMLRAMNPIERRALFAYLMSLPPKPFGQR